MKKSSLFELPVVGGELQSGGVDHLESRWVPAVEWLSEVVAQTPVRANSGARSNNWSCIAAKLDKMTVWALLELTLSWLSPSEPK